MAVLVPLPHMRHAHVGVEPMNFTCSQLAKAETKAGHTPHLMDVHDLLYNALKTHKQQLGDNIIVHYRVSKIFKAGHISVNLREYSEGNGSKPEEFQLNLSLVNVSYYRVSKFFGSVGFVREEMDERARKSRMFKCLLPHNI